MDIAPFLQTGENIISVLLWYFGRAGRSHMGSGIPAMRRYLHEIWNLDADGFSGSGS